jgi:enoyl-CoA hydratase/carnithine racemase
MFGRVTMLNIPTIAVVKGACIAGGCMLTFSHDLIYVVDKAVFACNEVDIGLPLPPGMNAVIKRKHTNSITFRDMTLFGKKFTEK